MLKVYIAGPYSKGDCVENTSKAVDVWHHLWRAGICGYVPHVSLFLHFYNPLPYQAWLDYDMEWLRCCDAVLRLPGESSGADKEVAEAERLGMPVYYTTAELLAAHTASARR